MADTVQPTIEQQIAAAELALHQIALTGGVTGYTIGDRTIQKNFQGMRDYLAELRLLLGASAGGGARNYASFGRRS